MSKEHTMSTIPQKSFLGNATVKAALLAKIQAQATQNKANAITLGEDARGSAIWWLLNSSHAEQIEAAAGVPQQLIRLVEIIFQRLPLTQALDFPLALLTATPVGVDLNPVYPKFATWQLNDPTNGIRQFADTATVAVIDAAVALYAIPAPLEDPRWPTLSQQARAAAEDAQGRGSSQNTKAAAQHALSATGAGVAWGIADAVSQKTKLLSLVAAAT